MDAQYLLVLYAAVAIPTLDTVHSRESLLLGKYVRMTVVGLVAILVTFSFLFRGNSSLDELAVLAGIAPLIHLGIYVAGCKVFFRLFGRLPVDTAFNMKKRLFLDRCFGLLVLFGPSVVTMMILINVAK